MQGTVEKKNTIPALTNILIESVGADEVRFTATDLDVTLIGVVKGVTIKTPGVMCVNARKLFDLSRLLSDGEVSFRKEDNNWATVKSGTYSARVAGIRRDEFPEVPVFKSALTKFPAPLLKKFISSTASAITLEESRYTLSGAKMEVKKGSARMITTDGHRLSFIQKKGFEPAEEFDALIPRKALMEMQKLVSDFEGEVGVGVDGNHIFIEVGERRIISRTLTGQFPNYEMVMPKNCDKVVRVEGAPLTQALRRVALMADDRSHSIVFTLKPNVMMLRAQSSEEGEAEETLDVAYSGEEIVVGFNAQYVQEAIQVMGDGQILFEFKDAASQAQMRPETQTDDIESIAVIMPMRT